MTRLPFLLLTLAGVFWGLGFPLGKMALREMDAAHMVLLRLTVAALAALPFALARRETRALFRSPIVLFAGSLYGLAFLVQFEGLARTTVTLSALLVGAMPALIAISARIIGEHISRASWIGVAAASLGAVLIAGRPQGAGSPLGVVLVMVSILIFLTWLLVMKRAPRSPTPMAMPAVTVIVAALAVLPMALILHGPPRLDFSPGAWAGIVGQGVLCTFLATAAWQYGAARVGSASAGVFVNIEPLMGASLGVLLFGDRLTPALAIGGLLILVGSFVVVLGERGAPPTDLAARPPTPA